MASLPPEIIESIIDFIPITCANDSERLKTLKASARASKTFAKRSQLYLFTQVAFIISSPDDFSDWKKVYHFLRVIERKPDFALLVRELSITIGTCSRVANPTFQMDFAESMARVLPRLVHLKFLSLARTPPSDRGSSIFRDVNIFSAITSSELERLSLNSITITVPTSFLKRSPNLKHLEFDCVVAHISDDAPGVAPLRLESLTWKEGSGFSVLQSLLQAQDSDSAPYLDFTSTRALKFVSLPLADLEVAHEIITSASNTLESFEYGTDRTANSQASSLFDQIRFSELRALRSLKIDATLDLYNGSRTLEKIENGLRTFSKPSTLQVLELRFLGDNEWIFQAADWTTLDGILYQEPFLSLKRLIVSIVVTETYNSSESVRKRFLMAEERTKKAIGNKLKIEAPYMSGVITTAVDVSFFVIVDREDG